MKPYGFNLSEILEEIDKKDGDKDEDERKMAKRKVVIENGIIKDKVVELYTNFIDGQM